MNQQSTAKTAASTTLIWALGFGLVACEGDQGTQGPAGTDGAQGAPGMEGAQGPQGTPGTDGEPGMDGEPGADGNPGPRGGLFESLPLPFENFYPEGIARADNGDLYLGSIATGAVARIPNGQRVGEVVVEPLTTLNGLVGLTWNDATDQLLACDQGTTTEASGLVVIDPSDGTIVGRHPMTDSAATASFCNDVHVAPDGTVYVTDSLQGFIGRVTSANLGDNSQVEVWAEGNLLAGDGSGGFAFPIGANGLLATDTVIWSVNTEQQTLLRTEINLDGTAGTTSTVTLTNGMGEATALVGPDGMDIIDDDSILIVDFGAGQLVRVDFTANNAGTLSVIVNELDGPTTVATDAVSRAWVPESQFDHLFFPDVFGPTPSLPFRVVVIDFWN